MKRPIGLVSAGIVGFGQVGAILCDAMRRRVVSVAAHDVVASKVEAQGVPYLPLKELVLQADYVLCTVTNREAVNAAEACRAFLSEGKTYVDLNSTSPSLKRRLEEIIRPSRATFAEGAILGAVGVTGANTRILMGGPGGRAAAAFLAEAGLIDGGRVVNFWSNGDFSRNGGGPADYGVAVATSAEAGSWWRHRSLGRLGCLAAG